MCSADGNVAPSTAATGYVADLRARLRETVKGLLETLRAVDRIAGVHRRIVCSGDVVQLSETPFFPSRITGSKYNLLPSSMGTQRLISLSTLTADVLNGPQYKFQDVDQSKVCVGVQTPSHDLVATSLSLADLHETMDLYLFVETVMTGPTRTLLDTLLAKAVRSGDSVRMNALDPNSSAKLMTNKSPIVQLTRS